MNSKKIILASLWVVALFSNMLMLFLYYWPQNKGLAGDEHGYISRATRISQGLNVEHLPIWPPGYDYFLSPSLYFANIINFPQPLFFAQFSQIILWIVSGVVFWKISARVLPSFATRVLALALLILNPTLTAFSHYFWPEIPHLTIYLIIFWILIFHSTSLIWNGVLGILFAVASLLKLVYLPISLFLMASIFIVRFFRKESLTPAILSLLLFLFLIAPTLLHNFNVHNKLMIADSSVFNIWVGLNDKELTDWNKNEIVGSQFTSYLKSAQTHNDRNKIYQKKIQEYISTQGLSRTLLSQIKKQYFRLFDHRTFLTKQLPGGMKKKYKFSNMALADGLRIYNDIIWAFTLLGLGVGIVLYLNTSFSWMHFFIGLVFFNMAIFLVLHVKTRYVIQFLPMLCLISSIGLHYTWHRIFNRKSDLILKYNITIQKFIFGIILSVIFLAIGFQSLLV